MITGRISRSISARDNVEENEFDAKMRDANGTYAQPPFARIRCRRMICHQTRNPLAISFRLRGAIRPMVADKETRREANVTYLSAAVLDLALRVPPSTLQVTRGASPLEFTGPGTLYRIRGTLFTLAFKQEMQSSPAAPRLATLFLLFLFTLLSFQPFP